MTGKHATTEHTDDGDLRLLSRLRDDIDGPADHAVTAVRDRLLASTADFGQAGGGDGPHRFWTPARAAVAASLAVVALVVPAAVGTLWPTSANTASAAEVLNDVADDLIVSKDLDIVPGQWLHVTVTNDRAPRYPGVDTRVDNFWVPYDKADYWYVGYGGSTYGKLKGGQSDAEAGTSGARKAFWGHPDQAFIDGIPRVTAQLRARLYEESGRGEPGDSAASLRGDVQVWGDLEDNLIGGYQFPADVRAALYRVLATIPGVTITDREVELGGRSGIAFGTNLEGNGREQIVVDPDNGRLLGVMTGVGADGVAEYSLSMTYRVVDAVPQEIVDTALPEAGPPR